MWAALKAHDAGQCMYILTCRPGLEQLLSKRADVRNPKGVLAVEVLKARRNPGHAQIIPARAVIRKDRHGFSPCWIELYNKRFTGKWPTTHFWAPARNPKTCVHEIHGYKCWFARISRIIHAFFTPLFPEICKLKALQILHKNREKAGLIRESHILGFQ